MQNRSGRSQNVSPPSTVPGASMRPRVGIPARRPGLDGVRFGAPGSACRVGAGSPPVGDQQRVEDVDEVRVVSSSTSSTWTRGPERGQRLDETIVLAPRDARGRPGAGTRAPGSSKARPNAAPGPL